MSSSGAAFAAALMRYQPCFTRRSPLRLACERASPASRSPAPCTDLAGPAPGRSSWLKPKRGRGRELRWRWKLKPSVDRRPPRRGDLALDRRDLALEFGDPGGAGRGIDRCGQARVSRADLALEPRAQR